MQPQIAVRWTVKRSKPDLAAVFDLVAPEIKRAAVEASRAMTQAGIRHALVGDLAAGAWGEPRAMRDVDFLVGDEAFVRHGEIVTFHPALPLAVGKVAVDTVPVPEGEVHLGRALDEAVVREGIPLALVEHLVFLKLLALRMRDKLDIVSVLRAGADAARVRAFVADHRPDLLAAFDELVEEARREE